MPPKRGQKRKQTNGSNGTSNGDLTPPDRATWPGWVEMESEPAFFNVMLKEMGVQGVKIQEVLGLDVEMLAILPPIQALIFLFRYRDTDQGQQNAGDDCPEHIWFANQVPDFACASVALLNIVNNIKGLHLGRELQQFRDFTLDMDPLSRGDAIDSFDFVKRIHNSFARETEILVADMHLKHKAGKAKRQKAVAKARETREANKATTTPLKAKSSNARSQPARASGRKRTPTAKLAKSKPAPSATSSSPLSEPPISDSDFSAKGKKKTTAEETPEEAPRRSQRKPQPRKGITAPDPTANEESAEEGFHFVAYIPIQGHVWKLDGLDSFPQDMGPFVAESAGNWIDVVQPILQTRMALYEGADIEFNLMAVVQDPLPTERAVLARNVKELCLIEKTLDAVSDDWRTTHADELKHDVVDGISVELGITQPDVDEADLPDESVTKITQEADVTKLVELRSALVELQGPLRGSIRDEMESSRADDEKARHRRHDYATFVRSWLSALADEEMLSDLLQAE